MLVVSVEFTHTTGIVRKQRFKLYESNEDGKADGEEDKDDDEDEDEDVK